MNRRSLMVGLVIIYVICLCIFICILYGQWAKTVSSFTHGERDGLQNLRELVLVGDANFPPLSFTDTKQQFSGYEADLVKALENKLGINVKYTQMEWADALQAVRTGQAVGLAGMRVMDERGKGFHFTRPYWKASFSIVTLNHNDLSALLKQSRIRVGLPGGSAILELFKKTYDRKGIDYIFVNSPEKGLAMLLDMQIDFWVENSQTARFTALRADQTGNLQFLSLPGSSGDYAMAFGEQYAYLVPVLNKALMLLEQDGTFTVLDKKWFGSAERKEIAQGNWVLIASILVFTIFTLLFIIVVSNTIFRKKVAEKTEQHRMLLDNIPIQVWYLHNEDTYGLVNEAHGRFVGLEPGQIEGKKLQEILHFCPEVYERCIEYNRQVMQSGEPLITEEESCDYAGNQRILNVSRIPKLAANGDVAYIVCSAEDITERTRAEGALRDSKNKIEKLHEIAIQMEQCRVEDEVFQLIIKAAEGILNFTICSVDAVEGEYFVVKATSSSTPIDSSRNMPITLGIGGKTYRDQKTYLIGDIWETSGANPARGEYRAAISAPVGDIGIFQAISVEVNAFSQEDVELTELLLSHAAEAIKRIRSEDKITYMSYHDSLTGLYNRAFFDQELRRMDCERFLPLSFILGDTNGLKLVNDVFGHEKGDELIVAIANILKKACRREDTIVRWGGDEFAILLPRTEEKTAREICRRVRKACLEAVPNPIQPSIALGVAVKETPDQQAQECWKEAENRMYRTKLAESRSARNAIIASLEIILWNKSYETREHACRLQNLSMKMGKSLGLPESQLDDLHLAAALHDIGNIAIPESIIKKQGSLTGEEWEIIKRHAESGYRIAQASPELGPVAEIILAHHEWWDGSGYPEGAQGESIPLVARIISIVDAYDVMTQGRPYKKALSKEDALAELQRHAGTQFDPALVELFAQIVNGHEGV